MTPAPPAPCQAGAHLMDVGLRIDRSVVTGPFTNNSTMLGQMAGGRIRETVWTDHQGWRAIACITKARAKFVPTNALSRCTAMARPACNVTHHFFGQAMCI